MRIMNLRRPNNKKVLGLKLKCSHMVKDIMALAKAFPPEDFKGCGYYHAHLPVAQSFIDSKRTTRAVRKLCIQTLVDVVSVLRGIKPVPKNKTRVVVAIDFPNLWDSQLIVFYGKNYFSEFFKRNTKKQKWTLLSATRNIKKEWDLEIPAEFDIRGYKEEIIDDDYKHVGEIWFIGELR